MTDVEVKEQDSNKPEVKDADWAEIDPSKFKNSAEENKVDFEIEEEQEEKDLSEKVKEDPVEVKNEIPELDGIETKGAEKRIRQLVRQRKEREEALQSAVSENEKLRNELAVRQEQKVVSDYSNLEVKEKQLEEKVEFSKKAFMDAFDLGEKEKILEAQTDLTNAQTDLKFLNLHKNNITNRRAQIEQQKKEQQAYYEQQQQQPAQEFDPKAQEWAERNTWFGQPDKKVETVTALAIDAELKDEGFDPSSTEFYQEVDRRLSEKLKINSSEDETEVPVAATPSKPPQRVAGQSRNPASKKVKLNREDLRLAKKWGIPLETYAAEKVKAEKAAGDYTPVEQQTTV